MVLCSPPSECEGRPAAAGVDELGGVDWCSDVYDLQALFAHVFLVGPMCSRGHTLTSVLAQHNNTSPHLSGPEPVTRKWTNLTLFCNFKKRIILKKPHKLTPSAPRNRLSPRYINIANTDTR
jgi:hypothetical protein